MAPEVLLIGEMTGGWQESLTYCRDNSLDLISFPKTQLQQHVYKKLAQASNDSLQDLWIGMRRSSLTGQWYWLNKEAVTDTSWEEGEPGTAHDGQCAIMSRRGSGDFGWSDEDCCKDARPLCYSSPVLFPQ